MKKGTTIFSYRLEEKTYPASIDKSFSRQKAVQHGRPILHLDLARLINEEAMHTLVDFIEQNGIEVLNVAGSRGSKDPRLYDKVFKIVYYVFVMTQQT